MGDIVLHWAHFESGLSFNSDGLIHPQMVLKGMDPLHFPSLFHSLSQFLRCHCPRGPNF